MAMVMLQLRQMTVPPGHRVLFHQVSWSEFEAILAELGEHRQTRVALSQSHFGDSDASTGT